MAFCPDCNAYVWCSRTVYPDVAYFTCHRHKHHFQMKVVPGEPIPGDRKVEPPTGYGEEDK